MAIKLTVNLQEIHKYPNIFMIEDLLVINMIKTEKEYIFMGISNSMYKDMVIPIKNQSTEEDADSSQIQTIDINIPNSLEEFNQLQVTLTFAFHLFSSSTDANQQELSNILSPKIAMYNKKVKILKLQELL